MNGAVLLCLRLPAGDLEVVRGPSGLFVETSLALVNSMKGLWNFDKIVVTKSSTSTNQNLEKKYRKKDAYVDFLIDTFD